MKLYDADRNFVGEIDRPGPIKQDGQWWEFPFFRPVTGDEYFLVREQDGYQKIARALHGKCQDPFWVASKIPRATPAHLAAIGMRERDGRPVECKVGDVVWNNGLLTICVDPNLEGKFYFVLVPCEPPKPPVEKTCNTCGKEKCPSSNENLEVLQKMGLRGCKNAWTPKPPMETVHTSCAGCEYQQSIEDLSICDICFGGDMLESKIRKNWTPSPAREQGFMARQIRDWLLGEIIICADGTEPKAHHEHNNLIRFLAEYLYDPEDGLAAVARRGEGK